MSYFNLCGTKIRLPVTSLVGHNILENGKCHLEYLTKSHLKPINNLRKK